MSGALGRASVDLDAELAQLGTSLRTAQEMTERWVRSVAEHPAKLSVDTSGVSQELNQVRTAVADVDRLNPVIDVDAEIQDVVRDLNLVEQEAVSAGNAVEKSSGRMKGAFGGVADSLSPVPLGMAGIGVAAVLAGKSVITAASDMEESVSKVNVVFEESAEEIHDWADDAADNFGLSEQAALAATGTFGNMLVEMGLTTSAASDMSRSIVELSADLGSFNNLPTAEVLEKIRAGLVGETEPLRSLGVNLNAASIEAKALELGLTRSTAALTPAMKAQAAYALIVEQTSKAQGDFARTSDGLANSSKVLEANVADLQAQIGGLLLPSATDTVVAFNDIISVLPAVISGINDLSVALGGSETAFQDASVAARNWKDEVLDARDVAVGAAFDIAKYPIENFPISISGDESGDVQELTVTLFDFDEIFRLLAISLMRASLESTKYFDDLDRDRVIVAAAEAEQRLYADALARQAEAAGQANRENDRYRQVIELGSGATAQAAFNLDKLAEAADNAWQGQQNLNTQWGQATEAVGFWEQNLSNAEQALAVLDGELEEHGSLTAEQQAAYDTLTAASGRYTGGIEDEEGALVDAAVAQANFIARQDELNDLLATDGISPADYAREMAELTAETDPAASAAFNLASAQEGLAESIATSIDRIRDLLIELGLIDGETATPEVDVDTTLFDRGAELVEGDVIQLNSAKATPVIDVDKVAFDRGVSEAEARIAERRSATWTLDLDISRFISQVNYAAGFVEFNSPAAYGPFDHYPEWGWLFETMEPAAKLGAGGAAAIAASYMPMNSPAEQGPLSHAPDWSFLFEGLDANAEDYVERAASAFIGFFGTIEDLYSGDTLRSAEAALQRLLTIREIAVEQGVGADIIAGIDAQIAAEQARVAAIGASMGTTIVQGILSATEAAEIAQQIVDGLRSDIGTFSLDGIVSGDALSGLKQSVRDMELMRDALLDAGVPAEALVDLNADIEEGYRRIALAGELLGTETVQHLIALAEAEREAALAAERTATAVELIAGSDGRGLGALTTAVADLDRQIALATFAGDWGLVESLTAERDEALALLQSSGDLFFNALVSGLISDEQLYAMFEAGGDAFVEFYEGFFGEGTWAGFQERYERQMAYVIDVDALAALLGESQQVHEEHIDDLVVAYQAGAISYEDALRFMADATGAFTSDSGRALLDYYNETKDLLLDATLSGENLEEAQERYDAFMAFLAEYAEEHGLAIDEILSDWERLYGGVTATVRALGTTMLGGGAGPSGGAFSGSGGALMTQGSAAVAPVTYVTSINQIELDGEQLAHNANNRIFNALPLPLARGG